MSCKKKLLFVVITVVLGLLIVEFLVRGAFYFFGRYDGAIQQKSAIGHISAMLMNLMNLVEINMDSA